MALPPTTDDLLFSCLSPRDLIAYSQINKAAHDAVESYNRRAFSGSLERLLLPYFDTPQTIGHFRQLQADFGVLISGSTALQFFERRRYDSSDLDIYVDHRYVVTIADFLTGTGYTFQPRDFQRPTLGESISQAKMELSRTSPGSMADHEYQEGGGVAEIYDMSRGAHRKKIQIITTRYSPLDAILNFHSTCVMQIISHSHAYSLYPRATFEERQSLLCYKHESDERNVACHKYFQRGWAIVTGGGQIVDFPSTYNNPEFSPDDTVSLDVFHTKSFRSVGDKFCWVIPLPPLTRPLTAQPAVEDRLSIRLLECNSWVLMVEDTYDWKCPDKSRSALHKYCLCSGTKFRYRYCIAPMKGLLHEIRPVTSSLQGFSLREPGGYALDRVRDRGIHAPDVVKANAPTALRYDIGFSHFFQKLPHLPSLVAGSEQHNIAFKEMMAPLKPNDEGDEDTSDIEEDL